MKKNCKLKYGWDEQSEKIAIELIERNKECEALLKKLKKARLSISRNKIPVKAEK